MPNRTHVTRVAVSAALTVGLASVAALVADDTPGGGIPAWALEEMRGQVGRWIADNSAYRSEVEPYDAYGLEWHWGLGEKSLTGRLFGLRDGEEVGTFWEFRQFWHPGERKLTLQQFGGDGTVGIGVAMPLDGGELLLMQEFFAPDGTVQRVGHRSERRGDVNRTSSFDVTQDGGSRERRHYVWQRR